MLKEDAKRVLIDAGFTVDETTVNKNGIMLAGLQIKAGSIAPVIYEKKLNEISDADKLLTFIREAIDSAPDYSGIGNWETDKTRVMACIRREISDNVVTRSFCDLQVYCRVCIAPGATVAITRDLLRVYGISEDELFNTAIDNTCKDTEILNLAEIIGLPAPGMFVLRTKSAVYGAGAITNTAALEDLAARESVPYIVLIPSSIHEFIALAMEDLSNLADIAPIIAMVNDSEVDPVEQLGTHPYIYTAATRAITAA